MGVNTISKVGSRSFAALDKVIVLLILMQFLTKKSFLIFLAESLCNSGWYAATGSLNIHQREMMWIHEDVSQYVLESS